jgi:hypothetical protein
LVSDFVFFVPTSGVFLLTSDSFLDVFEWH